MRQVIARDDIPAQPAERVTAQRRPVMNGEVVVARRVRRRRTAAVIAERPQSAAAQLEMPQPRRGKNPALPAGAEEPQREVRLETVREADEVLVEAADGEGAMAFHGEIAGHDVRHETAGVVIEVKLQIVFGLEVMLRRLARLQDLPDD